MTENETEDLTEGDEPQRRDPNMFEITAVRQFEIGLTSQQEQQMLDRTDEDTVEEAIERMFLQREIQNIEPDQRLIYADAKANESSDN
jgi:hypothetical protein